MTSKKPFIEKYAPKTLDDFIGSDILLQQLRSFVDNKNIPNLIIVGGFGVGKTSVLPCLIKKIYHKKNRNAIIEFNSYEDRGIKIYDAILGFCKLKIDYEEGFATHKLIIFDEADNIAEKSQQLINNCMTLYPNSRFVFICNDTSQIIDSIQSRCVKLNFSNIPENKITTHLNNICVSENIPFEEDALLYLYRISKNDMRATLNLLEITFKTFENITVENINNAMGIPSINIYNNLTQYILDLDIQNICIIINDFQKNGYNPQDILFYFINHTVYNPIIPENKKIIMLEQLSKYMFTMSCYTNNYIQLTSCLLEICDKFM